jgi:hypothetical protein
MSSKGVVVVNTSRVEDTLKATRKRVLMMNQIKNETNLKEKFLKIKIIK